VAEQLAPLKGMCCLDKMTPMAITKCNMQTDDDVYVRVDLLLQKMAFLPRQNLYWGTKSLDWTDGPRRQSEAGAFRVTTEEWAADLYPPYAYGVGYVVSIDLAREIAAGWLKHLCHARNHCSTQLPRQINA
jgi:hypothetical protein